MAKIAECYVFEKKDRHFLLIVRDSLWWQIDAMEVEFISLLREFSLAEAINRFAAGHSPEIAQEVYARLSAIGLLDSSVVSAGATTKWPVTAIQLHVTYSCNLSCTYCYAQQGTYGGPSVQMKWEVAKQAVDFLIRELQDAENIRISFFGGEPLLNFKLIKKVVPYARNQAAAAGKSIRFGMTTNGVMLTDQIRTYLHDSGIRYMVSMDGPKTMHDKLRRTKNNTPTFDLIENNIRRASEEGSAVAVRATYADANVHLREFYGALNSLPISNGFVSHASGQGEEFFNAMAAQNEEILSEELAYFEEQGELRFSPFLKHIEQVELGERRSYGCGGGRNFLAVTPDGGVYFCHRFALDDRFKHGNVWDGLNLNPQESTRAQSVEEREPCRSCWARHHCGGQCAQECISTTGDFTPRWGSVTTIDRC